MGQEIKSKDSSYYTDKDIANFKAKLQAETNLLKSWFDNNDFKNPTQMTGIELEAWLVDKDMLPHATGDEFIKDLGHKQIVPEISRFNFEINSDPYEFTGKAFSHLYNELEALWNKCEKSGDKLGSNPMMMGTLATLRQSMLTLDTMSPQNRYHVMNDQILKMRKGVPLNLRMSGRDIINFTVDSVLTECAATSLQIHLSMDQDKAKRYYNAASLASPFMVAVCANSPYFFGNELWDESRIAIFEQSVELDCYKSRTGEFIKRVTLGEDYVNECLYELFDDNLNKFDILLPEVSDDDPKKMGHLKLHNGTIWRWNRPIVGENPDGTPHLRVEHRTPSAGPTLIDSVANAAFFTGLVEYFVNMETAPEYLLDFEDLRTNFYKASKQSFYCRPQWIDGKKHDMQELLLNVIYPEVKNALIRKGMDKDDISQFMDNNIYPRIKKGINGARWQKAYIHMHGKKFQDLMEVYLENQKSGKSVHEWRL